MTGGLDWDTIAWPLFEKISPWLGILFVLFIAFTMLAMMNVVTGIFVENVQCSAKLDKEEWVMQNARECIKNVGGLKSTINVNEFKSLCAHKNMLGFFKYLDADPSH